MKTILIIGFSLTTHYNRKNYRDLLSNYEKIYFTLPNKYFWKGFSLISLKSIYARLITFFGFYKNNNNSPEWISFKFLKKKFSFAKINLLQPKFKHEFRSLKESFILCKNISSLINKDRFIITIKGIDCAGYIIDSFQRYSPNFRIYKMRSPLVFVGTWLYVYNIITYLNWLEKFAKKNQIRVIEDAAHAFGSHFKKKLIGSFGDITCFSFDGIKNITCGEGGAIVSNDKLILSKASDIRTLGIIGDSARRTEKKRSWSFDIEEQGYRYHMSDINAAIGVVQLKRFSSFQRKRMLLAKNYDQIFKNSDFISTFKRNYDELTPHIYAVKLLVPNSREALQSYLLAKGIQTGYHYFPNHQLTYFQKKGETLPVVENIFPNLLTLPSHVGVSKADVKLVYKAINSFYT